MGKGAAQNSFVWAGRIAASTATALGSVRLIGGLEALQDGAAVWVRGPQLDGPHQEALRRVPWEGRYEILADGQLRRPGRLLPETRLPEGKWLRLPDLLRARRAASHSAGRAPSRLPVELRPASEPREVSLLEARTEDWLGWVEAAPQLRLERLTFAHDLTRPEWVLIRGTPLPPLVGTRFAECDGIAVPAGQHWWPEVAPATLRTACKAAKSELLILRAERGYSRVPRSAWIEATRSAVRLTLHKESHAG